MTEHIIIHDGTAKWGIRLIMVSEWPLANWRRLLSGMTRNREDNQDAIDTLRAWFPDALREAEIEMLNAEKAYKTLYTPLKQLPKGIMREKQKSINRDLASASREARNKVEKLKARNLEFLAALASMKKEN